MVTYLIDFFSLLLTGWRESLSNLEVTVKPDLGVRVMVCIVVEEDAPGHQL